MEESCFEFLESYQYSSEAFIYKGNWKVMELKYLFGITILLTLILFTVTRLEELSFL